MGPPPARRGGGRRPPVTFGELFRRHGDQYRRAHALGAMERRALRDISVCRTGALGGHRDVCGHCGHEHPAYNSCRNRHCPKCQALRQARWVSGADAAGVARPPFPRRLHPAGGVAAPRPRPPRGVARPAVRGGAPPSSTSARTRSDWARSSASRPSSTPGRATSASTLTSTASSPAVAWRPTAPGASSREVPPASESPRSPLPRQVSPRTGRLFAEGKLAPGPRTDARTRPSSNPPPLRGSRMLSSRRTGSSTPRHPSSALARSSATSASTPTGSPSPTTACSTSTSTRSSSAPGTRAPVAWPPSNSCADSFSTSCLAAS